MHEIGPRSSARREAIYVGIYFVALLGYLFVHPESELEHWVSLVLLPLLGLGILRGRGGWRGLLASLGLERGRLLRGLGWALALGGAVQVVQFANPSNRSAFAEVLASPWGWIAPLVALPFLMVTVACTEEVFFRGLVQRRFADASGRAGWRAEAWGIGLATLAFVLYHVPYAYLNPNWPSAGDLSHALGLAALNGGLGGLVLGLVYVKSGRNLVSVILLHALVNWVPGTILVSQVKFGGG